MNDKIESKLANVPETMLITLGAKATETERADALIKDEKAVEMMGKIDYDFSKLKKASFSQSGCCVRARLIDMEAKAFLKDNPDAVVIQLGAGIDARYERLGKPKVGHWYDLDLPEAIELRRKLLHLPSSVALRLFVVRQGESRGKTRARYHRRRNDVLRPRSG